MATRSRLRAGCYRRFHVPARGDDLRRCQRNPAHHYRPFVSGAIAVDFSLTEEQKMLRLSVRRFLENECSIEARRNVPAHEQNRDHWPAIAELGWLAIPLPEA